ncbi:MAG: hypothetical protein ACX930_00510 [Erythrobacter sp.]
MTGAMSRNEAAAIEGIVEGRLEPLAELLNAMLESGNRSLHPAILFHLRLLIDGEANETDWRLSLKRHPDLKRGQSAAEQSSEAMKELGTAIEMLRNGVLSEGGFEAAVNETARNLGIGESTVERHWRNKRSHILNDIRWGIISADLLPGPIADRHNVIPGSMAKHLEPSPAISDDEGRD